MPPGVMVVYTPRDEVDSTGEENPHQEIEMGFAYSEGNPVEDQSRLHKPPFDTERLDRLMEETGLDALHSRHPETNRLISPLHCQDTNTNVNVDHPFVIYG